MSELKFASICLHIITMPYILTRLSYIYNSSRNPSCTCMITIQSRLVKLRERLSSMAHISQHLSLLMGEGNLGSANSNCPHT